MIYQTHPTHGRHIAYNGLEAEANRKNGWKDVTKAEFYGEKKVQAHVEKIIDEDKIKASLQEAIKEDYDAAVTAYEFKFGKKPHHRMNYDSILKALDAESE